MENIAKSNNYLFKVCNESSREGVKLFKVNNKDTRMILLMLTLITFGTFSSVSIAGFEHGFFWLETNQ